MEGECAHCGAFPSCSRFGHPKASPETRRECALSFPVLDEENKRGVRSDGMFCRNCGKELGENAVACLGCGCDPRKGNKFCHNCGAEVTASQIICVKCGVSLTAQPNPLDSNSGGKDKTTFLVLGILLGSLGIHNFYAGYTAKGIAQLCISVLSCGVLAIVSSVWGIIDAVTVENDASGVPFRK